MPAWRGALSIVLVAASPAMAQDRVVTSPKADRVALTVYRAPGGGSTMNLRYLAGYALVTETRRVRLPRGRSVLRFAGVAEGIVPVSAVIDGLPGGVVEKNRDLRLLSPAALVDGTLGREVTLTRTDPATGARTSEPATIVAGPARGVVLKTAAGIETLRCAGLPERLTFAGVPAGLSGEPVLGVTTVSPAARTATVRLSYLASAFDWRASYVASVRPDGRSLDLFAWLTLANGNPAAFIDAEISAVAGRLNRIFAPSLQAAAGALSLSCYPLGTTTSDLKTTSFEPAADIVLTASRLMAPPPIVLASMPAPPAPPPPPPPPPPEDLGDLKLYRLPERIAVAARGQKQVALLSQPAVAFERRYRRTIAAGIALDPSPTAIVLVMRNRKEEGLGVPLPSGTTAAYAARAGGAPFLLGLGTVEDRAEGERVRIAAGTSRQVLVEQRIVAPGRALVRVTNALPSDVAVEVPLATGDFLVDEAGGAPAPIDGKPTWSATIPANDGVEWRYSFRSR